MSATITLKDLVLNQKDSDVFLKNYHFKSTAAEKEKLGEVFLMLEVLNASPSQAKEIGKEMFAMLKHEYFNAETGTSYERFEEALKQVNNVVNKLIGKKDNPARINAVVAVLSGSELHLSQTGYAEAYLVRNTTFTHISEGLYVMDNTEELFQNIASGLIEEEDRLIFSSERLLRFASQTELAKIFHFDDLDQSLVELKDIVSLEGVENINVVSFVAKDLPREENTDPELEKQPSPYLAKLQDWLRGLEEQGFSRNMILGSISIIVIVLILTFWVLGSSRQIQENDAVVQEELKQIEIDLDNASRLSMAGRKGEAAEVLNRAEEDLKRLSDISPDSYREHIVGLLEKLDGKRDTIDEVVRITNANVLADLSGKRIDVQARGLINANDDRKYVYDQNALYETILSEVHDPITIDGDISVVDGTNFSEMDMLVFLAQNKGVIEYDEGIFTFANTDDEEGWKQGVAVDTWSTNIYVLDPSSGDNGQIWKYARTRSGYRTPVEYNNDGDIKSGVDLTIDGNIWVLNSDGRIEKLLQGNRQDIQISDPPSAPLNNPTRIYTSADLKNIYVLDNNNSRVISYYKDISNPSVLEYYKQYDYSEVAHDVRDFYVNTSEQKMYLLTDSKIIEFEI